MNNKLVSSESIFHTSRRSVRASTFYGVLENLSNYTSAAAALAIIALDAQGRRKSQIPGGMFVHHRACNAPLLVDEQLPSLCKQALP